MNLEKITSSMGRIKISDKYVFYIKLNMKYWVCTQTYKYI